MLDNDLINLLATRLEAATAQAGWLDSTGATYGVSQKQQPTQQGVTTVPQVFFEKLFDIAFGYPEVTNAWDDVAQTLTEVETQLTETTFQISAMVIQNPADLTMPTTSDVVNFVRSFLVARQTIRLWQPQGVSILRVSQIRNPYIEDDRHRNEATTNFDIVVTHSRVLNNPVNYATEMDGGLIPV
jgi:hypothetical protein